MNKIVYENYVLDYINKECGTNYKILEINDFYEILNKFHNAKNIDIKNILINLENKQFISIKYFDNTNICLCITELGKQILNNANDKIQKNKKIKEKIIFLLILILIFAFLGSFLGTIICNLIFNLG